MNTASMQKMPAPPANGPQSVSGDIDCCIERLFNMSERVEKIGDQIYGSRPTDANAKASTRPMSSIASRLSDIGDLLSRLEDGIGRIDSGL